MLALEAYVVDTDVVLLLEGLFLVLKLQSLVSAARCWLPLRKSFLYHYCVLTFQKRKYLCNWMNYRAVTAFMICLRRKITTIHALSIFIFGFV